MTRKEELQKMKVLGELDRLCVKYGIDSAHLMKSEMIDAILKAEGVEKTKRPPRNHANTKLKALRVASGLSQRELSEATGINLGTLKMYEQGAKNFDSAKLSTILKTCIVLKCSLSELLGDSELLTLLYVYNDIVATKELIKKDTH